MMARGTKGVHETLEEVMATYTALLDQPLGAPRVRPDSADAETMASSRPEEPLLREALGAALRSFRADKGITLRELAEASFVSVPRSVAPRAWRLLEALRGDSASGFEVSQEANQYATVLALVAADVGAAIVPASVRGLRSDDVHYLRLRDGQAFSEVQAVRRQVESRPEARDLHDLMVRTLRGS